MAYIGRDVDKISNVEVLDNITFDGSSSYTLQKNSVNFTPSSANTLLVSIDGVVQAGNFTVSGSTIDFGTAVAGTSTCDFILHYGIGLITTPADGTVTTAKLSATGTKDATTFLRGDNTFNGVASLSTASGSAPSYSARAWVNFNGTGVVAIRDDGNVTSITDEGTGDYTVNFTTAMPDVNYSLVGTCTGGTSGQMINIRTASLSADPPTTMSTTAVRIRNRNDASTINDPNVVCIGVFR
jgi:hypothetical protein